MHTSRYAKTITLVYFEGPKCRLPQWFANYEATITTTTISLVIPFYYIIRTQLRTVPVQPQLSLRVSGAFAFMILDINVLCGQKGELINSRVATAQGKQGIWLLTFPDRESTGNLVNLIFYTGKIGATQGKHGEFNLNLNVATLNRHAAAG